VRQPDWWQGDSKYHVPAYDHPVSELERKLAAGEFVVTSEVTPPLSSDTDKLIKNIEKVKPYVTALNFTDNASATPRMTSWACSTVALDYEAEPVLQISARNRSRSNLQSEVIGASALGVRNILCVTGDSARLSPSPREKMEINDLDAIQMLWILRRMRDEGKYLDGREMKIPPKFFLGAAASPFSSNPKFQALREQKKVNAGAQFFQTNLVFDINGMEEWLNELAKRNVLDKVYILIGITPIKSLKTAVMLSEVPGVYLPGTIIRRMDYANTAGNAQEEGVQIALELISQIRKYHGQGVNGIHLMPVGWDDVVPRIIQEADLLPKSYSIPENSLARV
jgi:methylenetetrahydrofolate reductase (NADPH)